jgi:hypothetical protein
MRVITPTLLVAAVTELSRGGCKLVRARDVFAWCDRNAVDYQGEGRTQQPLWEADLEEARGQRRLLKFKSGECKQSRVGWALPVHAAKAREAAARLSWHEQFWDGEKWDWVGGVVPQVPRREVREKPVSAEPDWISAVGGA